MVSLSPLHWTVSCMTRSDQHSITCRKRHLKCDEVKPICGACAKKDNLCEFASSSRRSVDNGTSASVSDPPVATASPPQQSRPAVENNERSPNDPDHDHNKIYHPQASSALFEPREDTGPTWHGEEADTNLSPPVRLDQVVSSQSPATLQEAFLSPSNASFAAVQWFGLLANDAARDNFQVSTIHSSWANQSLSLDHAGSDGQTQLSSLQCATQVLDSPSSIYSKHDPTRPGASGVSALEEEQIWQSKEPIDLLPTEANLFEHFINRVSPWVC